MGEATNAFEESLKANTIDELLALYVLFNGEVQRSGSGEAIKNRLCIETEIKSRVSH